jgi:uncharacterized protein YaiI (UPF0178 family)
VPVLRILVDADACPVKDEIVRVAERHGIEAVFISNAWMRLPDSPLVKRIGVEAGMDAADNWIADQAMATDVIVTNDIPLASRCVAKGAKVLRPNGRALDANSIGMAVAVRDLHTHLRDMGEITGGPAGFQKQDRSRFLDALETAIQAIKRQMLLT